MVRGEYTFPLRDHLQYCLSFDPFVIVSKIICRKKIDYLLKPANSGSHDQSYREILHSLLPMLHLWCGCNAIISAIDEWQPLCNAGTEKYVIRFLQLI